MTWFQGKALLTVAEAAAFSDSFCQHVVLFFMAVCLLLSVHAHCQLLCTCVHLFVFSSSSLLPWNALSTSLLFLLALRRSLRAWSICTMLRYVCQACCRETSCSRRSCRRRCSRLHLGRHHCQMTSTIRSSVACRSLSAGHLRLFSKEVLFVRFPSRCQRQSADLGRGHRHHDSRLLRCSICQCFMPSRRRAQCRVFCHHTRNWELICHLLLCQQSV